MRMRVFRKGSALITCAIMLAVVSALAIGLATIAGANLQIADNQQEANRAFASAESGLEVMRYWLGQVRMPSSTSPSDYLSTVVTIVQDDLDANNITNFTVNTDGSIPAVTLDSTTGQTFTGQWSTSATTPTILNVTVTGISGTMSRTLTVDFSIEPYKFPIFNYGIATKGALEFPNNPTLTGATQNWEADIYVESTGSITAVDIGGNANFDGNIDIGNPLATIAYAGDLQIAGDHGQTAVDNHVNIGADPVEFPIPETTRFEDYATGGAVDPSTLSNPGSTLVNAIIPAGMNPTFSGNVTIQGILFIKTPNVVTFSQNVQLQGLIVAEGDALNPGTNQISFEGNFASGPYPPGSEFDAIRQEQGSSIIAPGFGVSFTGNFASVNGVLAASSMFFSSNASAVVKGTMMSFSPDATRVEGNVALNFDRAAMVEIPAGFDLLRVLAYRPSSYAMVF